ncbi:Protein T16G12.1, partial [Aphelenchoides avenae]
IDEYGLPPLPRNVEVLRYDLHVQPYFPDEAAEWYNNRTLTFEGFVRVSFRSVAFADHLSLDMKNLSVLSVRLYQGDRIVKSNHSAEDGTGRLRVVPEGRSIPPLNYSLEIAYAGDIVFGGRENGVIYGTYKNRRGNRSFMVYTQFEPQDARRMMPCWDDPHFKAVVQLTITYPEGYTVLSNTIPQANYTSGGGYVTTTFYPTPRMSTYLIAFAVGKLVSKLDVSSRTLVRVWGWEGMEDYLDYALRSTVGCIVAMKEYTQMDFGQPKL